jgi:hypothetical protein
MILVWFDRAKNSQSFDISYIQLFFNMNILSGFKGTEREWMFGNFKGGTILFKAWILNNLKKPLFRGLFISNYILIS